MLSFRLGKQSSKNATATAFKVKEVQNIREMLYIYFKYKCYIYIYIYIHIYIYIYIYICHCGDEEDGRIGLSS